MQTRRRSAARSMVEGKEAVFVLGRSGNDLLSRVLRHSTIGAEEFNGRVRDGIGFRLLAQITGPAKDKQARVPGAPPGTLQLQGQHFILPPASLPGSQDPASPNGRRRQCAGSFFSSMITNTDHESNQANRAISTSKLNTLPRLHTWPINVVVFHGSQGSTRFKVGFPLRCLQRLSRPYIATLHCGWRHNSSTRGTSIPVLSY
jgi:hypothetical protein